MVTLPLAFIIIFLNIVIIPVIVFYIYSLYKLFEKCDIEGWKSLIPFYNVFIEIRLAGCNWWYILLYTCPFILAIDARTGLKLLCGLIVLFVHSVISYNLCRRINNGKNSLILDFLLLTFIPIVYLPVMALNDDFIYHPEVEVNPNGYIDEIQTAGVTESKPKTNKKKKICDKCGEVLSKSNRFCPNCGKKI